MGRIHRSGGASVLSQVHCVWEAHCNSKGTGMRVKPKVAKRLEEWHKGEMIKERWSGGQGEIKAEGVLQQEKGKEGRRQGKLTK